MTEDIEEITVKDIVRVNKIRKVEEKLLVVIEQEKLELSKSEEDKGEANVILLTGTFNILTTIVASDIDDGVFDSGIIQSLIEDFKIEIARKLEIFTKKKIEH